MAKPKYPETSDERARVYLHCMLEIKERLKLIEDTAALKAPALFRKEICYLQLRYICELVAMALLTAQGDFKTQRAFTTEYSPPKIFAELVKLYPHFFPQPAAITSVGNEHHVQAGEKPGAYSEKELVDLWQKAGSHLHRASYKHYLNKTFGPAPDLSEIQSHVTGLVQLLECHILHVQTNLAYPLLLNVIMDNGEGEIEANFLHLNLDDDTMRIERYKAQMM